jgi:hypothetical protein
MKRAARLSLVALLGFGAYACILHLSACDDGTHVYLGRFYRADRNCLGTSSSIDVVPGDVPGTCPAVCLTQRGADATRVVYVSTMCPPYPAPVEFDTTGADPECAPALAALGRGDTCLSDGGSTHPGGDGGSG